MTPDCHSRPPGFVFRERGQKSELHCEGIPLSRLAEKYGTPLYVYSAAAIRERVKAGMVDAKKRGVHLGRKHTLRPNQRQEAIRLHAEGQSIGKIAALFGCGRTVVHRAIQGA